MQNLDNYQIMAKLIRHLVFRNTKRILSNRAHSNNQFYQNKNQQHENSHVNEEIFPMNGSINNKILAIFADKQQKILNEIQSIIRLIHILIGIIIGCIATVFFGSIRATTTSNLNVNQLST
jgi:hypothetical protein